MTLPSFNLLAQSILSGIFIGSLYGLIGLGLGLTWGLLRQINLSHFGLVFLGAYLSYQMGTVWHLDPLLALLVVPPVFFAIGVGMQWVLSRFAITPFNSLLVTFGITVVIEAGIQAVWTADYRRLESSYNAMKFTVAGLYVPVPELLTLVLAVGISVAVWAAMRYTDVGKALRAMAEDGPIAAAFGINAPSMSLVLAGAVAALAGVAGVCLALTFTLAPSQIFTWVGVVFAAVMLGGLGSALGPLFAGMIIGVSEAVTMAVASPSWAPIVSFSLLIVMLLFRPGEAWNMNKTVTGILAAGVVLASVPWLGLPAFYESFLYLVLHWMVLALSWNILSGYSGYFSFGHGAFFGIGMYTTAGFAGKLGWPFLATLPVAAAMAALLGLVLGFVVFRVKAVRGELFALLTLAVTFVVATVILNTPIDGGPGVYLNAVEIPKLAPTASSSIYLMIALVTIATLLVAYWIYVSKLGLGLFAIHDDEDVAEVMGVPTFRYKLVAFAISCALAGLAGGIHALFISYVTAGETFNITVPLTVVLMSVLGGTRHWAGPAVGAAAITTLLYVFTAGDSAVAGKASVGVILVLVILFLPNGILGFLLKRKPASEAAAAALTPTPLPQAGEGEEAASVPMRAPAVVTGKPLLEVRQLSKAFKGVQALDTVTLQVRQGEILGLLGPNGSGKSTFINVVTGHYPLSGGEVLFEGRALHGLPAHRIAHAGIARTYQIPRPFKHMTVLQNVSMVAMFGGAGLRQQEATREAWKWLEFTGLQGRALALPDDLNLHQRKFLELARALAARPRLVLLDEVLSGLTPSEINEAIELIRRIRDQGSTIVFVEHVMRAVMALTDRIVVLNHGKLIAQGEASEVMQDREVVSAYLGRPAHA